MIEQLVHWFCQNHLELNLLKTVEMIMDSRRIHSTPHPLNILNNTVSIVDTFRFLGSTVFWDMKWTSKVDIVLKKA